MHGIGGTGGTRQLVEVEKILFLIHYIMFFSQNNTWFCVSLDELYIKPKRVLYKNHLLFSRIFQFKFTNSRILTFTH
jgi:hypothetical protein